MGKQVDKGGEYFAEFFLLALFWPQTQISLPLPTGPGILFAFLYTNTRGKYSIVGKQTSLLSFFS
jgi:hypothetical protein